MVKDAATKPKLVAYERVSTARQGRSGLGLEAQKKAIEDYADAKNATILARFTEIGSGRKNDRPELAKALQLARLTGATLVIAKLDRLSRNAAFLLTLRDSGLSLVVVDMPEANDLTVGITTVGVIAAELNTRAHTPDLSRVLFGYRAADIDNSSDAPSLRSTETAPRYWTGS